MWNKNVMFWAHIQAAKNWITIILLQTAQEGNYKNYSFFTFGVAWLYNKLITKGITCFILTIIRYDIMIHFILPYKKVCIPKKKSMIVCGRRIHWRVYIQQLCFSYYPYDGPVFPLDNI